MIELPAAKAEPREDDEEPEEPVAKPEPSSKRVRVQNEVNLRSKFRLVVSEIWEPLLLPFFTLYGHFFELLAAFIVLAT